MYMNIYIILNIYTFIFFIYFVLIICPNKRFGLHSLKLFSTQFVSQVLTD